MQSESTCFISHTVRGGGKRYLQDMNHDKLQFSINRYKLNRSTLNRNQIIKYAVTFTHKIPAKTLKRTDEMLVSSKASSLGQNTAGLLDTAQEQLPHRLHAK